MERQLGAKEATLPQEPASDDENAVNLMVRMPDGSRRGRRFVKSDKLQVTLLGRNSCFSSLSPSISALLDLKILKVITILFAVSF